MKSVLIAILAIVLGTGVASAGTGSVEGTVMDQLASKPVGAGTAAVSATCGAVKRAAFVDGNGHFMIANLPEGTCTLTITGGAYATTTASVTITASAISTVLVNVLTKAYVEQQRRQAAADERRYRDELNRMSNRKGGGGGGKYAPAGRVAVGGMARADAGGDMVRAAPRLAPPPAPRPPPPADNKKPEPRVEKQDRAKIDVVVATPPANRPVVVAKPPVMPDKAAKLDPIAQNRRRWDGRGNAQLQKPMQVNADGWAVVRVFPVPTVEKTYDGPRSDFRETVYWNPSVETNGNGTAEVTFVTSDAITSFKATAEGFSAPGVAGGGDVSFASKLPMTLDARLPVEVTSGDSIRLPITLANETSEVIEATLSTKFGAAFKLTSNPANGPIKLAANTKQTLLFPLDVVATDGNADVEIKLVSRGLTDEVKKTIRVVPRGFPIEGSASGTATRGQPGRHTVDLAGALPGSIKATVMMYPSPVAAIAQGMDGMIREPGGCFEQASSSNYPNTMILAYMQSSSDADAALVAKTQKTLDRGYKLLTGYETSQKGYEWFGKSPGHEALTAYGLMEFADMSRVYDVDRKMVERTADWLMSRRDGQGGFQRSAQALDSFGRANPTTTNAYIMWALAEAKRTNGMTMELASQKKLGNETRDPYLLALASNVNLVSAPAAADTQTMVKKLAALQGKDGAFAGAKETITMSGGESLGIETTALATLALIKASPKNEYEPQIRSAVQYLNGKRGGFGSWGNTQATILGLKALTAYSEHSRQMAAPGTATIVINGKDAGTIKFDKGRRESLVWDNLADKLVAGKNTIEVRLDSTAQLPYTIALEYRSTQPKSAPRTKVAVTTQLLKTQAKMGDGVTLRAHIENTTDAGIPMTLARIGLPGGTVFQTWQLKELRDKGLIDFYETRPREVILYWRALPPNAKKDIDLNLLAQVPGTYEGPASSAYLYYTAEDKAWTKPVAITIDR